MKIKKRLLFFVLSLFICNIINMKVYAEGNSTNKENVCGKQFLGEREINEENIPFVDESGNIIYVDMSKADTEVDEKREGRSSASQVVNFAYKSGVIEYIEEATKAEGYVVGKSGADAAYLGTEGENVRFMLSGVIGLVPKDKVQIIRKDSAKSLSYYSVSEGRLYHYITSNLNDTKYAGALDNGPAPSYLKSGVKYYSYDGHYFYKNENFEDMLDDYKKGDRNHSVNKSNPFYNYFQYLPFRSQSNYNGDKLNMAINNRVTETSKMRNIGKTIIENQNRYGVNALLITGIAANESGWGKSSIAQSKNNLFGLNAVDSSPGESANYFESVDQCIKEFAEKWMSKEYLNPKSWKYFGGFLGNKSSGINVKYASDPYWGEKAAAIAWRLDKENGERDINKYTIAVKDMITPGTVVNVRNQNNTSSKVLYKTPEQANCTYIILNRKPMNNFYKIQSDGVLNEDRSSVATGTGLYDFENMFAYLSADYLTITIAGGESPISKEGWVTENGKKYYYENGNKVTGEKKINKKWYYFDKKTGVMATGWYNHPTKKVYYSETGEMVYGEKKIAKKWYYFNKTTGAMTTGWYNHPTKKVYYSETGEMVYGEKKIAKKWYYFNKTTGVMTTGWYNHPTKKVYYSETGEMVYGEKKIAKKWYYFNKITGAMTVGWCDLPGKRVYYLSNGQMAYGKQVINGKVYQFDKVTGALKR